MDKNPDDSKTNWYFKYFGTKQFADIRSQTLGWLHLHLGHLYGSVGNYRDQVNQYFICEKYWYDSVSLTFVFMNLGGAYVNMNKLDSALFYETKAYQIANPAEFSYYFKLLKILGIIYTDLGNFPLAKKYFYQDVAIDHSSNRNEIYSSMSLMYIRMGIRDSALYFANLGNQLAMVSKSPEDIIYARNALAQIYDSLRLPDSALKYQKQLMSLNDSIFGAQKLLNFQQVYFDDQARSKEIGRGPDVLSREVADVCISDRLADIADRHYFFNMEQPGTKKNERIAGGSEKRAAAFTCSTQSHSVPTHSIRKNGFAW